ncbi:hypothetical protein ACCC92_24220 [Mucilaginibacter sp. Mucisp84]|uniref:hypothetical protein n=1 Tax=Mucilaginibacter sp. Mucisp84 TaxID=3243058 RepID=UPI0039A5D3F5
MTVRSILKQWFSTAKKPTAGQFAEWIDSFWHKSEDSIPVSAIDNLSNTLAGKASTAQVTSEASIRTLVDQNLQNQINALAGSFDMRAFISLAPVCENEADAQAAELTAYTLYKTSTGELRYKLPVDDETFTYTLPLILS